MQLSFVDSANPNTESESLSVIYNSSIFVSKKTMNGGARIDIQKQMNETMVLICLPDIFIVFISFIKPPRAIKKKVPKRYPNAIKNYLDMKNGLDSSHSQ